MCIIVMKPADKTLTEERIDAMWKRNSDGAGFMYAENGELKIVKGLMTLEAFKTALTEVGQDRKLVIHFRIRTHGAIKPEMTHPFQVTPDLGMAHNGTISKVTATAMRSDSAVFASLLAREYADPLLAIQNKFHREMIEAYIGSYNKLVFMDASGEHYILNETAGTWEDGVWYSNTTFRNYTTGSYSYGTSGYSGYSSYPNANWSSSSSTGTSVTTPENDEELDKWINARATVLRERSSAKSQGTLPTLPPLPLEKRGELVKYVDPNKATSGNSGNEAVQMRNAPILKKVMDPTTGRMTEVKTYPVQKTFDSDKN